MTQPYSFSANYALDIAANGYPAFLKHRQAILAAGAEILLIGCPDDTNVGLYVTEKMFPIHLDQIVNHYRSRAVMYRVAKLESSK